MNDVFSLFDHTFVYISGQNPLLGYGLCERTLLLTPERGAIKGAEWCIYNI